MADSRTDSASPSPGGRQQNHGAVNATKLLSVAVLHASSLWMLKALCLALVLLAAVAPGNAGSGPVLQVASSTAAPLRLADERESIGQSEGRKFNFTRYKSFVEGIGSKTLTPTQVLSEATKLMRSMTQAQTNSSFIEVVGQVLYYTLTLAQDLIIMHQDFYAQLVEDARLNLLSIPLPIANDPIIWGRYPQVAALRTDNTLREPIVALCSPRGKASRFEEIPNYHDTKRPYDKCDFVLTMSSTALRNTRIAVVAYPANRLIRSLPSIIGHWIHNGQVVDVAIEVGDRQRGPSEDTLLSIFFKPSLTLNTTKGCSYWNKTRGDWTTDGCWVDTDLCQCNLSAHLKDEATGVQYIVYEHSDVFFNESSYEDIMKFDNYLLPTEYFFADASALMHNLSLIPANQNTLERLHVIVALTLTATYKLPYGFNTTLSFDTILHNTRIYKNARKILRNLVSWISNIYSDSFLAIVCRVVDNYSDDKGTSFLINFSDELTFLPSNQRRGLAIIQEAEFRFALTASRSVAEQNKQVVYMVFKVNHFLIDGIWSIGRFQVHNFQVVDVTLVPRVGVQSNEDQFIDIWYRPSMSNVSAKNGRLGCAYWSDHDSAWIEEGCVVHVSLRGCTCNLSAHFNESREGGQYAIYEASDTKLEYVRIGGMLLEENQQDFAFQELVTFVHNMTEIGYVDDERVSWACGAALHALTIAKDALERNANRSNALREDLRLIGQRWARDNTAVSATYGLRLKDSIRSSSPVAVEAHEVLSNQAVQARSSLLHQVLFSTLKLGLPKSPIGVKFNPKESMVIRSFDSDVSADPQFSFCFSVASEVKMRFAAIVYPLSQSFLPLTRSLPAIFSYHVVELAIVSEETPSPSSDRLVTLVHVPDGPKRVSASTACAVWTGSDWSTQTCWPETDIERACTCNLSAHALEIATFLPLLVYEVIEAANFTPKGSIGGLDILYVVLSTASLVGLLLIALTAVVFPQWRADVGHKILLHLSLALFLYQMLRLIRETHHVYTALNRDVGGFVAFAAVTHYSRLAHYAWMLAMSVLQLRRLLSVVGAVDTPHLLLKVSALAWGVPLVPLAALLSWDIDAHFARPDTLTHLVLYLVPGIAVTLVNGVLFVIIAARVCSCCGWGKVDNLERHGISGTKLTWRRISMLSLLFFLFGTPTVFETFNDFWGHSVVLEALFKVFDPVRGAVVFVYFVLLDRTTFGMWRQKVRALATRSATRQDFEMR